jgi:hypothetical protein
MTVLGSFKLNIELNKADDGTVSAVIRSTEAEIDRQIMEANIQKILYMTYPGVTEKFNPVNHYVVFEKTTMA